MKILDELGYKFYFNYTITGLPDIFESNVPDVDLLIDNMIEISDMFSPKHINWRYDPIVISNATNIQYHLDKFEYITSRLQGKVERCYFSFMNMYPKIIKNIKSLYAHDIIIYELELHEKIELISQLADIAKKYNITLYSCSNDMFVNDNIKKAHCVDGDIITELFGQHTSKSNPTRTSCGCINSIDIGEYNTCTHGCIYCYANNNNITRYTDIENITISSKTI